MKIKIPLKFDQANLRQLLAKILAGSLFLGLSIPQAQARKQNGQRGVGARPAVLVNTLPEKSKRYALIIGVDQYSDSSISPLDGASNDAKALADALMRYAGFPSDQVILLASDQPPQRQPTRGEILLRLSNLRGAVSKDGLLLVAFAGHGIERNSQAYLLPSDARIHGDVKLLEDTSISVTRMRDDIQEVGVGQVLLFLDACRNDPASSRSDSINPLTGAYTRGFDFNARNSEVTAFVTLYATQVGARAYEYKEKRQGYFTWALVEGLKGAAANEHGEVTLSKLISHVQEAVPKRVQLDLGRSVSQKPFAVVAGYRAEELVLAVGDRRAPDNLPDVEIAYWNTIKDSFNPANFRAYLDDYPQGRFRRLAENRLRELDGTSNRPSLESSTPPARYARVPGNKPLVTMSFTTVRVDASGRVSRLPGRTVNGYIEQLPRGAILEMVEIAGGSYLMGTSDAEAPTFIQEIKRYYEDRGPERWVNMTMPQHQVTIGDFYMGKYEITQGQWKAVMGSLPPKMSVLNGEFKGDDLPVVNVSWDEAKEFIRELNRLTGVDYRLPSEAEWEYAARAGSQEAFSFGPTITPEVVNYKGNYPYGQAAKGKNEGHPVRVGSYPANAYGLFDMHGNVGEWCEDDWHISYRGAPADGRAWVDISNRAPARVGRGGSWYFGAVGCRSAIRSGDSPGTRYDMLGFRLSKTASER